jgi:hypothetical protein
MTDSVVTARADVAKQVAASIIAQSTFPQGEDTYTTDDATLLFQLVRDVLGEQWNPGVTTGLAAVATKGTDLYNTKSTDCVKPADILARSQSEADDKNTALTLANKTANAVPDITERGDAVDEADRENLRSQSTVGGKQGVIDALVQIVGTDATDSVVKKTMTDRRKHIDDIHLDELFAAIEENADRPASRILLDRANAVINTRFDFSRKCNVNIDALKTTAARLGANGVKIGDTLIAHTILANVEDASQQKWGTEFVETLREIRRTNASTKVHDAASIAAIATALAKADAVRVLSDAEPLEGAASAVQQSLHSLQEEMLRASMHEDRSTADGSAFAAESDSESDGGYRRSRGRSHSRRRSPSPSRSPSTSRSPSPVQKWKSNPCPHCKTFKRNRRHPNIDNKKCFYNKKYKGWSPEWVCKKMGLEYLTQEEYDAKKKEKDKKRKK